eukprot:846389-Rhodomonas_salina.1
MGPTLAAQLASHHRIPYSKRSITALTSAQGPLHGQNVPKQALPPAPHQPLAIGLGPNGPDLVAVPVVSVARPQPDVPPPQHCRRSRAVA